MGETKMFSWFRGAKIAVYLAMTVVFLPNRALAAEEIIFTYGAVSQSVSLTELRTFVKTGETSASLDFILSHARQNPTAMRWILNQKFPADSVLIWELFNTAPGEYLLSQTGKVISSESERANIQALRGASIASASDDNLVSAIELLENYPTRKVYLNGKVLAKMRIDLGSQLKRASGILRPV